MTVAPNQRDNRGGYFASHGYIIEWGRSRDDALLRVARRMEIADRPCSRREA